MATRTRTQTSASETSSRASASPVTAPASELAQSESAPVKLPGYDVDELIIFRESEAGKKLASWCREQFINAREARTSHQHLWYTILTMVWGNHYIKDVETQGRKRIVPSRAPSYVRRKKINLLRTFARREQAKFQATFPSIVAVPATGEDEDVRAAYAAEQAWESMRSTGKLNRVYSRAIWWQVLTGNGFLKQWWDPTCVVPGPTPGTEAYGDIKFESVSPFHIFVPDLMAREVDDQPYIIQAQTKTIEWARTYYADELRGVRLDSGEAGGSAGTLDSQFRLVADAKDQKSDKVTIYEYWVRRGATPLLPDGGLVIMVNETIVAYSPTFPYKHGEFPYSKLEHIPTDTFYGLSPLVDLLDLQKEYNELRTDIAMAQKRMGQPQLLAFDGSIVTSKMTNEPGSIIGVRPGFALPTPVQLSPLPQYVIDMQDRIRADFEDLSGQHEISQGSAPTGVTAGTALSFLKEVDDSFLLPQYQNIEQAIERTASQSLSLFNEFVDTPRKLKVIGKDGSFDVLMLEGSDIQSGLDVRVEQGSSIGESRAAKHARLMEMFQVGAIDQQTFLRMSELGGPQKYLDTLAVAAKKANRENLKMKALKLDAIQQNRQEFVQSVVQQAVESGALAEFAMAGMSAQEIIETIEQQAPPAIPVDDFDIHEIHLEEHNRYRMSQEYETLPEEIKQEFQKHCEGHEHYLQQAIAMQMMMSGGGTPDGGPVAAPGQETPGPEPLPGNMTEDEPAA